MNGRKDSRESQVRLATNILVDGETTNLTEVSFNVNEQRTVFPIIIPDASIAFRFPLTNLSFSAGISSVIAPISYVDAAVTYFGDESELSFDATDKLFAYGLLFGINYVFGDSEK